MMAALGRVLLLCSRSVEEKEREGTGWVGTKGGLKDGENFR